MTMTSSGAEHARLQTRFPEHQGWKEWGPYLSERQWGTVREDYSPYGTAWDYFPHDHARSRTYRWGEDGIAGFSDRQQRLCLALAVWNERDPILKERLFGLTNNEGNHGEDVKELYYYLDATPTHSYLKMLYKYPQREFPYASLADENRRRGIGRPEFELVDTGLFDDARYFDVYVEYAQAAPNDICMLVTAHNRGPEAAPLRLLPTLWFRNTWSWKPGAPKPRLRSVRDGVVECMHQTLGTFYLHADGDAELLFTENETNVARLYGASGDAYYKDAFHDYVIGGARHAVNATEEGSKVAAHYLLQVPAGGSVSIRLRLAPRLLDKPFAAFRKTM